MLTRVLRHLAMFLILPLPACGLLDLSMDHGVPQPVRATGTIVNPEGGLLQDVEIVSEESRDTWDLFRGFVYSPAHRTYHASGEFDLAARHSLHVTFKKEGYYPRVMWFEPHAVWHEYASVPDYSLPENAYHFPFRRTPEGGSTSTILPSGLILREDKDPRHLGRQRIVLEPHGPFTTLQSGKARLVTRVDGSGLAARWQEGRLVEESTPDARNSGAIFLEATRFPDGGFVTVHVPGYGDRHTPPRVRLAAGGERNGFIRKTLEPLPSIERQLREAPADGYGDAVFPQDELERLMRLAQNRSWFFVRINGLYGRGCLETFSVIKAGNQADRTHPSAIGAYLYLWMQPDGTRNLETAP
jgi:hypothetical protein